jgi:hypothetical protein
VIGVTLDGESRAYPLRVLNWHEIVDDHLGATPIAVTYHPLCDSAAVFDRRVMGEVLDLRASGLLYQSNQLLYDHRDEVGTESLWCQLSARAIAGPAAKKGEKLVPLPFSLVTWSVWKEKHPDTTIVEPDPDFSKHYGRRAYANYFGTRELRYRVDGYPPPGDADPWGRVALVADGDGRSLVAVEDLPQDVLPSMYFYAFRWAWAATR